MNKSLVSIKKLRSIDNIVEVREAIWEAVDLIGGLEEAFRRSDRVLIKPNLLMPMNYRDGGVTNPIVVEAVIDILQDFGIKKIIIGEGAVVGEKTLKCFEATGLDKIAERKNVLIVDLKKDKFVPMSITNGKVFRILKIPEIVANADAVINIPVLKTHDIFPVSLGLKNMKGVIHENDKQRFHSLDLAQCIVDLNKLVLPRLTIIDGTIGMEGLGPVYGTPANMGIIIASNDTVAADTIGSMVMGINPFDTKYIKLAAEQELGNAYISKIEVLGNSIKEVQKKFKIIKLEDILKSREFRDFGIKIVEKGACSGCKALITSLITDAVKSEKLEKLKNRVFIIGPENKAKELYHLTGKAVFLGNCTRKIRTDSGIYIAGCPPHILNVKKALGYTLKDFNNFTFMKTHLEKFGFRES